MYHSECEILISVSKTVIQAADRNINQHAVAKRIGFLYEHRSALRSTSRFGFAGIPSAPKGASSGVRTAVLWALIEQRKRNKPPFRNRLGSLAAIGLVLARCAGCSALLGAV